MIDSLELLRNGNRFQVSAYEVIDSLRVLSSLESYDPIVVGTIPIDIYTDSSDIDIICSCGELRQFQEKVVDLYSDYSQFSDCFIEMDKVQSYVAKFSYERFWFEIFCQDNPSNEQNAFLHMVAEQRLLEIAGGVAKREIRKLKLSGLKTEPAFCSYFDISGDPYESLKQIAFYEEGKLREIVEAAFSRS